MTRHQPARQPAQERAEQPGGLAGGRRSAGSWLEGARQPDGPSGYPGKALGLPEAGAGSAASMGRRLAALMTDWIACTLIAFALIPSHDLLRAAQDWTIVVFAAESWLLTALTGLTLGKRLLGIRVARLDGRPVGFGWALLRTLLLLAVVPPLVTDRDLRGLHDRAANTVVVRR